jgi:hypothetical protein
MIDGAGWKAWVTVVMQKVTICRASGTLRGRKGVDTGGRHR